MSEAPPDFDTHARDRDTAIPRFYVEPRRMADVEGQPRYEETEYVEILVPGDRKTSWVGLVNAEIKNRFPRAYEAFKQGREAPVDGTPLSDCAWIERSRVEELAFARVKTVEALAGLSDDQLKTSVQMGGYQLREKAIRHLEQIKSAGPNEKLAAENVELKANMAQMQAQMDDLLERMKAQAAQQVQPLPPSPAT